MAIDTAAKRKSAVHASSPWRNTVPFPDGVINQGDRQALAYLYSGILAGEAGDGDGRPHNLPMIAYSGAMTVR